MTNNTVDFKQPNKLAGYFHKLYGSFTYSGTLALEVSLRTLNLTEKDVVLVPNNVCYRILLALIYAGVKITLITPNNGFLVSEEEYLDALRDHSISAVVVVYNLGIPISIQKIRELYPDLGIIEDASQFWGGDFIQNSVGKVGDYVITSFGMTKPLSSGIGGAIFGNNKLFRDLIDTNDKNSRMSQNYRYAYGLSNSFEFDLDLMIEQANKIVTFQRKIAKTITQHLSKFEKTWLYKGDGQINASWQRFPIRVSNRTLFNNLLTKAKKVGLKVEVPHKLSLDKLPLAKNMIYRHINNFDDSYYNLHIKTRQNSVEKVQKWLKQI